MQGLKTIQNKELKKVLEESYRFSRLPNVEQRRLVVEISNSSIEKQKYIYLPFFKKLNEEEDKIMEIRESKFASLIAKIKETDKKIKSFSRKNAEIENEKSEKEKESELINQLKNL